ncbi:MAG: LemA family protein [Verrucomicrobiota bacterium]
MSPQEVSVFVPLVGAGLGLLMVLFSLRTNRLQRLMSDMPTSKTTGVFIGFNELKGRAALEHPLVGHLSRKACVYYTYNVSERWSRTVTESYTDSDGRRRTRTRRESGWKTLDSGGETVPFFLEDSHGRILVRPSGAEMEVPVVFSRTCGRNDPLYYAKGPQRSVSHSDHRRRFVEKAIPVDATLYVLGQAREREDIVAAEIAVDSNAPKYLISTRTEEAIAGSKKTKAVFLGILGAVFAGCGILASFAMRDLEPPVGWVILAVLLYVLVWLVCWSIHVTNSIIGLRNRVRQAFSLIEVQLKRRAELIPKLVKVANAAGSHEKDVQSRLAAIRSGADESLRDYRERTPDLLALVERYPELSMDGVYFQLQEELSATEERIALARSYYNETASFLNTRAETFPDGLFSKLAGVKTFDLYEIETSDREVPEISA